MHEKICEDRESEIERTYSESERVSESESENWSFGFAKKRR